MYGICAPRGRTGSTASRRCDAARTSLAGDCRPAARIFRARRATVEERSLDT